MLVFFGIFFFKAQKEDGKSKKPFFIRVLSMIIYILAQWKYYPALNFLPPLHDPSYSCQNNSIILPRQQHQNATLLIAFITMINFRYLLISFQHVHMHLIFYLNQIRYVFERFFLRENGIALVSQGQFIAEIFRSVCFLYGCCYRIITFFLRNTCGCNEATNCARQFDKNSPQWMTFVNKIFFFRLCAVNTTENIFTILLTQSLDKYIEIRGAITSPSRLFEIYTRFFLPKCMSIAI